MPDPISDALLQAYLDLMDELTKMHRIIVEPVPLSEQDEGQTSPDPTITAPPE